MVILTIRTDRPEAEIGLYDGQKQLAYKVWTAHRELSASIHKTIQEILQSQAKGWSDIGGIVCFKGPGSFTGLRIGLGVGNALAYSLQVPIISAQDDWIEQGIKRLLAGESEPVALPEYGQPAAITSPRK